MLKQYYKNAFHHVYSRGANKELIFRDEQNYLYFLKRLRFYKEKYKISIICFILMPNHFHFETKQMEDYPLFRMMQYLLNGYTLYFNKKYKHAGCLFESKFKAILIEKNEYLLWLNAYIHTNSSVAGIVSKPEDYKWSSYKDYLGLRNGTLCDKEIVLSQFSNINGYKDFVKMAGIEIKNRKDLESYLFD